MSKQRIGVGVIVQRDDGSILLGYRHKRGEVATWCMPGGHVEPGESFEQAAIRELHEETGLQVDQAYIEGFAQHLADETANITGIVTTRVGNECIPLVTEPEVFSCWEWFTLHDLPSPLYPASNAALCLWQPREPEEHWRLLRGVG